MSQSSNGCKDSYLIDTIEFFSGIGGYAFAIKNASLPLKIIKSYDVNTRANQVYHLNHGTAPITKGIDRLQLKDVSADAWLMSPPCQPFTAGGKRRDDKDPRSEALLRLIDLLPIVKPKLVFVENVFNFEKSKCRELLVTALASSGYKIKEFMLSPVDYGIPNNRKRYYLAAFLNYESPLDYALDTSNIVTSVQGYKPDYINPPLRPLSDYILNDEILKVNPNHILKRTNFHFDVVTKDCRMTSTFTKSYGSHHFFGSGSILTDIPYTVDANLVALEPRFFSPKEVAKFMGMEVEWPEMTTRQKFMLLGNSVSVDVVQELLTVISDTLILGAGPAGLYSALQILKTNAGERVVVAEKRTDNEGFLSRTHIIMFFKDLVPELCNVIGICPREGVRKEAKSEAISIKNLQISLLKVLEKEYKQDFEVVKLEYMTTLPPPFGLGRGSQVVEISLNSLNFPKFSPDRIIDCTGSKADLMNGILKVPFSNFLNHGPAMILSWPGHETKSVVREKLHDCSGRGCFREGVSNFGLFSDPSERIDGYLRAWGFRVSGGIRESPGYNNYLDGVFKDLDDPLVSEGDKHTIKEFFEMIRKAGNDGITALEALQKLRNVESKSVRKLLGIISNQVVPNVPKTDPEYENIWKSNLAMMRLTVVPSRIERHLKKIKVDNVPLILSVRGKVVWEKKVQALAIGDSLAITDFVASSGTNRAFSVARQIFGLGIDPETVFEELKRVTFPNNGREDYKNLARLANRWIYQSSFAKGHLS